MQYYSKPPSQIHNQPKEKTRLEKAKRIGFFFLVFDAALILVVLLFVLARSPQQKSLWSTNPGFAEPKIFPWKKWRIEGHCSPKASSLLHCYVRVQKKPTFRLQWQVLEDKGLAFETKTSFVLLPPPQNHLYESSVQIPMASTPNFRVKVSFIKQKATLLSFRIFP